jgi:hypothetical protein
LNIKINSRLPVSSPICVKLAVLFPPQQQEKAKQLKISFGKTRSQEKCCPGDKREMDKYRKHSLQGVEDAVAGNW